MTEACSGPHQKLREILLFLSQNSPHGFCFFLMKWKKASQTGNFKINTLIQYNPKIS